MKKKIKIKSYQVWFFNRDGCWNAPAKKKGPELRQWQWTPEKGVQSSGIAKVEWTDLHDKNLGMKWYVSAIPNEIFSLDDWVNADDLIWHRDYGDKSRVLGNGSGFRVRHVIPDMPTGQLNSAQWIIANMAWDSEYKLETKISDEEVESKTKGWSEIAEREKWPKKRIREGVTTFNEQRDVFSKDSSKRKEPDKSENKILKGWSFVHRKNAWKKMAAWGALLTWSHNHNC